MPIKCLLLLFTTNLRLPKHSRLNWILITVIGFHLLSSTGLVLADVDNSVDCTAEMCQLDSDELRFFIIGDWGGINFPPYRTQAQESIAEQMTKIGSDEPVHFTVSVGDNFYARGVTSVDDIRFQQTFEDTFSTQQTMHPWYISAGNHDHYGSVDAQIQYTQRSSRWKFPSNYYRFDYKLNDGTIITTVVLDTIILCGNAKAQIGSQPEGPEDPKASEEQFKWIEEQLVSAFDSDYIIVVGHYPVQSIGEHGPTWCLVDRLEPMLFKYNVNLYLSGHDHNMQHLKKTESDWIVHYMLCGGGAYMNWSNNHERDVPTGHEFFYPTSLWNHVTGLLGMSYGAFGYGEISRTNAEIVYYSGDGTELYRFKMQKRPTDETSNSQQNSAEEPPQIE